MLVIRAIEDIPEQSIKKDDLFHLYLVDAHHHMGREKTHRNTPTGSYEFFQLLWFEMRRLAERAIERDELLFEPVDAIPTPFVAKIFSSRDSWSRMKHGWLVDRTIVFPYSDDYSKQNSDGSASFKISNDKIAGWTTRAPHSSRLIGFARVDPTDATRGDDDIAVRELDRAILDLGLRGLKLHPLAQLFIDELEDEMVQRVVYRAAELRIPVLFDTRNIRTVTRIHQLVTTMREDPRYQESIGNLKVILAHCGMSPASPKLYDVLKDPAFTADTSTLHDQDIPLLFEMASERVQPRNWSETLLFGTDYSFLSVQGAEFILQALSRDFPGDLSDVQRILGGNTLSLVQKPFNSGLESKALSKQMACPNTSGTLRSQVEDALVQIIHQSEWDLSSVDMMIPPKNTWPRVRSVGDGGYNGIHHDSYIVTLRNKSKGYESHLWIRENPGDVLTVASIRTRGKDSVRTTYYATANIGEEIIRHLTKNTNYEKEEAPFIGSIPKLLGR